MVLMSENLREGLSDSDISYFAGEAMMAARDIALYSTSADAVNLNDVDCDEAEEMEGFVESMFARIHRDPLFVDGEVTVAADTDSF